MNIELTVEEIQVLVGILAGEELADDQAAATWQEDLSAAVIRNFPYSIAPNEDDDEGEDWDEEDVKQIIEQLYNRLSTLITISV